MADNVASSWWELLMMSDIPAKRARTPKVRDVLRNYIDMLRCCAFSIASPNAHCIQKTGT